MTLPLPLHRVLIDYDLNFLRTIADLWDVQLAAGEARAAADELAKRLVRPAAVAEVLETLPAEARGALNTLVAAGGVLPLAQLNRQYGEVRAMGPGRRDREQPWLSPTSPLETLWYRGLIGRAFGEGQLTAQEFYYVPGDLLPLLPRPEAEPKSPPGRAVTEPVELSLPPAAFVDDACTVLAYLQSQSPVGPLDTLADRLERESQPRGLNGLHLPEFMRHAGSLPLVLHLTQRLGLADAPPNQPVRLEALTVRPFLTAPRWQQLQALAEAWQTDPAWNDQILSLTHSRLSVTATDGHYPDAPLTARQAVLALLAQVPVGEWWSLESFVQAMKERSPDFQRPAGNYDSWLIQDERTGEYLRGFDHWDRIDGEYIRYLVSQPLHWLGLVELGHTVEADSNTRVFQTGTAFRLTREARALLHGTAWPADPEPEQMKLNADATLDVPRYVNGYDRFTAARFTDWLPFIQTGTKEPTDSSLFAPYPPYRYRISAGSLRRAKAQGVAVRHVLTFLSKSALNPVPQPLIDAMWRWEREGAEATLAETAVLKVKSPEVLERLRASPKTRNYLGPALGPLAVEVKQQHLDKLRSAMAEIGLLPDG